MDKALARSIVSELHTDDKRLLLDALMEVVTPTKPTKPSILDEEWDYDQESDTVYHADGRYADFGRFKPQLAAAPDAFRAVVMVRDKGIRCEGDYKNIELTLADTIQITAALKKARVE